jgi:hypothetical protein
VDGAAAAAAEGRCDLQELLFQDRLREVETGVVGAVYIQFQVGDVVDNSEVVAS